MPYNWNDFYKEALVCVLSSRARKCVGARTLEVGNEGGVFNQPSYMQASKMVLVTQMPQTPNSKD